MPTINTRVKNKHDTEANWSKSNLIPLNGEIIIFEADDNTPYPRFKVGDGETNINNLPFTDSDYVKQDELGNYVTTDNVNQSINNKCILYTEVQSLTEEQKAQARNNIGVDSGGGGNNIANATVTLGASLTFNGSEQEQTITSIMLDGTSLNEGTDYKVAGNIATDPVSGTLMAAFPASLRAVMRPATKYTDNTGGRNNNASYVTATQDYMPLLAEFEVQGERAYANSAEQNYQMQYAYYANGNSKVKYRQTSPGSAARWWCRSPYAGDSYTFCTVNTDGGADFSSAYRSLGVSPAFFI